AGQGAAAGVVHRGASSWPSAGRAARRGLLPRRGREDHERQLASALSRRLPRSPGRGRQGGVCSDRSRACDVAAPVGGLVNAAEEERIALDVHTHLAPVLTDRLGAIAAVDWSEDAGALTIVGYTLASNS